ncbi:MAG: glucose-1-phosphate adenylyltransferase subunit GlgD [Clostridiales bacterium]|jgi:glucose-1-phosphate adenylyltransferase|nr:glucose-1-phosphate adenylyltransferase subunit GlgD [Clostridiales bacterium]
MKTLGIVFSSLHAGNIPELTGGRSLAGVPFGGRYRLIDFVVSSMVNSGVDTVGVITKHNYRSLMDHVGSGKFYGLARKYGGLIILPPFSAGDYGALFSNRLEALQANISFLRRYTHDYVVLSDCDNICNVDYREMIASHERHNADITLLYREKEVQKYEKERIVLTLDRSKRVTAVSITDNREGVVSVYGNIMVARRAFLIRLLEEASSSGLHSFSHDILAKRTDTLRIFGYRFDGYFASIDSLANYHRHTLEMLDERNRASLFDKNRPVYTKVRDSAPTRYIGEADVRGSFIADGCVIEGTVENSVLFRGVRIGHGAVVRNSILMQSTAVGEDASLECVVTDKNVVIRERRTLGGCEQLPYYVPKGTIL